MSPAAGDPDLAALAKALRSDATWQPVRSSFRLHLLQAADAIDRLEAERRPSPDEQEAAGREPETPGVRPGRPESLVLGRDSAVIPLLLEVHAAPEPDILDACHNRGVMWKGLKYRVTSMDIDPEYGCEFTADFRSMPFADESFDVIAFDPPHLPAHAASPGSSGIERHQYGLTEHGDYRQGDNVSPAFEPFLREAKRVLRPNGIVIAKIADLVHNHRYQWQHVDFINACNAVGLTACDVIIKGDPCASNLKSSKWQNVRHFRRAHCYWIVVRKGRCEAPRAALPQPEEKPR